jgi:hypothetical protein
MPGRCRMGMRQLGQHTTKLKYDIVELLRLHRDTQRIHRDTRSFFLIATDM